MFLTLKRIWEAHDADSYFNNVTIPIGRHEIEKIPNPLGYDNNWLVLKGTLIGASEGSWKQWEESYWNEFQVIIEE